jgi:hypothetical protein
MPSYGEEKHAISEPTAASCSDYLPPSRLSKVVSHIRRFWWMHLISFILGTIPFLMTIFLVSIPM